VKEAVKDRLIDPQSAQFGAITFSTSGSEACAEVNAKNRMGGYTGRKQVQLRKLKGQWVWVGDFEVSHDECVRGINDIDREQASAPGVGTASFAPPSLEPGVITIVAIAPLWVKITDRGKTLYEGVLASGQSYKVPKEAVEPEMKAAKPEVLEIYVGEKRVAQVGEPGHVVTGLSLKPVDLLH